MLNRLLPPYPRLLFNRPFAVSAVHPISSKPYTFFGNDRVHFAWKCLAATLSYISFLLFPTCRLVATTCTGFFVSVLEQLGEAATAAAGSARTPPSVSSTAELGAKLRGIDSDFEHQAQEQLAAAKAAIEKRMYEYQRECDRRCTEQLAVEVRGRLFVDADCTFPCTCASRAIYTHKFTIFHVQLNPFVSLLPFFSLLFSYRKRGLKMTR